MKPDTQTFYELAVQRAVEHVIASLDAALDLHDLARVAALSPFHFHRIFRGMLGETPVEMHRRLRMERAAWSLCHEGAPVTTIAFAAGYETHESFTRAFRAYYDCSPSELRQRGRLAGGDGAGTPPIELATKSGIHFSRVRSGATRVRLVPGARVPITEVVVQDLPELRVAATAHVGPYNRISEAFARLGATPGVAALIDPTTWMLAMYHDDPEVTPASELRSEAGVTLPVGAPLPAGLIECRLPAGRWACTTHVGPYEQLGDAWARFIGEWLPWSGERIRDGVSFEMYRNTPANVPKEKLETELHIPIA
jgi:AraC family transcriptional regulator